MAQTSAVTSVSNYVKVCEAIQAMCYISLPTIQDCVEKWHQNHQPQMQACQTPSKCPAGKKPSKPASCQGCIDWGKTMESECYPPGKQVEWRNVHSTVLHKDPVEVAKGFLFRIPSGQNFTDFSDFDIGGILKLMMGFVDYHGGDQVCYDKMQKVLDIRNGLSHMKIKDNMHISDKQLDIYCNDIEECVDAVKGHQQTLKADEIKNCIKQIHQSAVTTDMTGRAQGKLSDGLKQALEEAQAIQMEQLEQFIGNQTLELKQAVQDSVAKGADEVVAKLKPELDMIHKELGKHGQPMDSDAAETFDLKACQEELKEYYLKEMGEVNLLPWVSDKMKEMESIFVDLELVREDKSKQSQKLDKNESLVTLKTQGVRENRILVTGDAGSGKSTMAANIAYKWAKQDPESPLSKFSLVFMINVSKIQDNNANLMDLIFERVLSEDSEVPKEGLEKYIKDHAKDVLLLIDGMDEDRSGSLKCKSSEITKVIHNRKLRKSCVILTSRPHKVGNLGEHLKHYTQVKLKGFSFQNMFKYIFNFLQDRDKTGKLIAKLQEQPHILALASIPVLLVMICLLWEDECELPQTKTQLYEDTIKYLWRRYQSKMGEDPSSDEDSDDGKCEDQLNDLLNKLGQVALQGVHIDEMKVIFDEKDFGKGLCDFGCHLGILSKERLRSKLKLKTSVTFLHATFQEFCIAVHVANLIVTKQAELDQFYGILYQFTPTGLFFKSLTLDFCCGLQPQITSMFAKYLSEKQDQHVCMPSTSLEMLCSNTAIHLTQMFESQLSLKQCTELVPLFSSKDNLSLTIRHEHIPSILYLLKLHESSLRSMGLLSRLRLLEITTGFQTWLPTLLGYTSNLISLQMILTRSPTMTMTDIELIFRAISALKLESLRLRNKIDNDRFDVTDLLRFLTQRNVRITHLKLEAFQFDIKTMIRYMSALGMALYSLGLRGSIIGPFQPGFASMQEKLTAIHEIVKNVSSLKKLEILELGTFRVGGSIKYLRSVVPQLHVLALVFCALGESHLKELFSFLKKAQKLKVLNLSQNIISATSMELLVEALQYIPLLEELMLANTGLTDESACILAKCLKEKATLKAVNLDNNPGIGSKGRKALVGLPLRSKPFSYFN